MKEAVKLLHYVDPGHSWLRVPLKMLKKLGLANKISSFSYQRTEYAYLEEDCDMTVFMKAMEVKGQKVVFVTRRTDRESRIRNYGSYDILACHDVPVLDVKPVVAVKSVKTKSVKTKSVVAVKPVKTKPVKAKSVVVDSVTRSSLDELVSE
jgi:hypothetical protein